MDDKTLHQPLAECQTCHKHRQLPKHYQDMLSEPPPALPPPSLPVDTNRFKWTSLSISAITSACFTRRQTSTQIRPNGFGLFWQYFVAHFLDHGPGESFTCNNLMCPSILTSSPSSACLPMLISSLENASSAWSCLRNWLLVFGCLAMLTSSPGQQFALTVLWLARACFFSWHDIALVAQSNVLLSNTGPNYIVSTLSAIVTTTGL